MKKTIIITLIIIILSILTSIYFYNQMPNQVASHWNAQGNVDGYMSKFWGLFLLPIVSFGILLLFLVIPKIDPLKENIKKFRNYFNGFILAIIIFLTYIYILTLVWNLGTTFNMTAMMVPALGILFFYIGIILKNIKRNWFIGIKTPWTISNDKVWKKTHDLGSILFKVAGVITLLGIIFQKYAIWLLLIPILGISIYLIVYSYIIYRKI